MAALKAAGRVFAGVPWAHSGEHPHGFGQVPKGGTLSPHLLSPSCCIQLQTHLFLILPRVSGQVMSPLQVPGLILSHTLCPVPRRCSSIHWHLPSWRPVGLFPVPGQPSDPAMAGVTPKPSKQFLLPNILYLSRQFRPKAHWVASWV